MSKLARPSQRSQRRVFRRRRRLPVGMVIRHLLVILLLLSSGIGIVVLLQRLPEQVDLMVLVSQAISDLISGIQQLLSAMLGLGGVVLIAALVILAAVLMLAGLWRLLRLLRMLFFPNIKGAVDAEPGSAAGPKALPASHDHPCSGQDHRNDVQSREDGRPPCG